MNTTKSYAALSATTDIEPHTITRREPNPHDIQIEIMYCGICHSDLHAARNEWGSANFPLVPGHEIVGKITAVGAHVVDFKIGDLAGVGCMVDSCKSCENCDNGLEQYCTTGATFTYNSKDKVSGGFTFGGYSSSIVVNEKFVLKIADNQPLEGVAPLLCAGITTYSPLKHWKVGEGTRVGILGLGGLGHMGVKIAVSLGAEVTMLSHTPSKEIDAKRLGAHKFILTTDTSQTDEVKGYFDFILDTVSAEHDYNFYLSLLRVKGTMVCVGVPPSPAVIPAINLIFGTKSFAGSLIGGIAETQEMLDYCAKHNIVSDVEVIAMNEVNHAYERMLKGDVRYRFVIDMTTL